MKTIVDYGKMQSGLSPTLIKFVRLDTMEDVVPAPAVGEIMGTGAYYFDYNFPYDTSPDIFFQMDAGPTVPNEMRYRSGVISPNDTFLDKRVSTIGDMAVQLQPVIDAVNSSRQLIMGTGNRNNTDIYNKVQNIPASGLAGQVEVDASIEAARAALAARIDGKHSETQSTLGQAITDAQTAIQNLITAARQAIMGAGAKSITDIDAYTKNLPGDPASQAALAALITAARDSTNSTVMNSFAQLRGTGDQSLEDIFAKVQGLPDQELAQAAQVAALPAAILALIGGADFNATTDTLHQVRLAVDDNATKLNAHTALLTRVLGMLKENAVLDSVTYDSENNLTAGRLRLYDSKEHAAQAQAMGEDDDTTPGKIAEYVIQGSYIGGLLESYVVTRETP